MKKAIWLAVLVLLIGVRAQAATDPKTLAFLKQLNQYYYCLNRAGLKKFRCELVFSYMENMKANLAAKYGANDKRVKALKDLKFFLNYQGGAQWNMEASSFSKTGDADFDNAIAQLTEASKTLSEGFMQVFLANLVIDNQFSDKDMAEADFHIRKNATGFQILCAKKDVSMTIDFDPMDKATNVDFSSAGKTIMSMQPGYISDPKGVLANALKVEVPSENMEKAYGVVYQPVAGFQLPATLDYKEHPTTKGAQDFEATVTFKNYQIN